MTSSNSTASTNDARLAYTSPRYQTTCKPGQSGCNRSASPLDMVDQAKTVNLVALCHAHCSAYNTHCPEAQLPPQLSSPTPGFAYAQQRRPLHSSAHMTFHSCVYETRYDRLSSCFANIAFSITHVTSDRDYSTRSNRCLHFSPLDDSGGVMLGSRKPLLSCHFCTVLRSGMEIATDG